MIERVPCELEHLLCLDLGSEASAENLCITLRVLRSMPDPDGFLGLNAYTLLLDDTPIACGGVWPIWEGVAAVWSALSLESLKHPKALHKAARGALDEIEARLGLKRMEAAVLFGHDAGHRWMRHLGFREEGLMRNYGVGGTSHYHRYARTT